MRPCVFEAIQKKTGKRCAIKMTDIQELEQVKTEICMQTMCGHPNVVSYIETFQTSDHVWMVMEFVEGGPLTDLVGVGKKWQESHIAYVCREMLKALAFVHSQHRLHRDIKSDNVLVDLDGNIKLADFGFAVGLTTEKAKRQSGWEHRTGCLQSSFEVFRTIFESRCVESRYYVD